MTTITAHQIVTPDGMVDHAAVTVDEGRIVHIDATSSEPEFQTVTAGFVDLQVNGIDDIDIATMAESDWPRLRTMLTDQGVTSWCPTLVTTTPGHYAERLELVERLAADPAPGPAVIGVHLEGPYLGTEHGAHTDVPDGPIDLDWITALPDIVRIMTLGPERPNALEAIELLSSKGILVALGHTSATFDETTAAIDAGARLFTHCFNANRPLGHRDPGPIGAALSHDDIAISLVVDGVHIHPAITRIAFNAKPNGRTILITDATAWRSGRLGQMPVTMRDGAPRLDDGTLAGSSLTMNQAVRNAVHGSGIELTRACHAASSWPADLLDLADVGVVAPGQRANLVALDNDFNVAGTWINGDRLR